MCRPLSALAMYVKYSCDHMTPQRYPNGEVPQDGIQPSYLYAPKSSSSKFELPTLLLFSVSGGKLAPSERKLCVLCQTSNLRRDQLPLGNIYYS